jgi:signal transduction histidine kinase
LARKNEELESLLYAASHDLRSPLVNIEGFSQQLEKACRELKALLANDSVPEPIRGSAMALLATPVTRSLHYIHSGVGAMNRLLSGLLQLSRLGRHALRIECLDVGEITRRNLDAVRFEIQQAAANVTAEVLPACRGDAGLVSQVLGNYLDNALKYRDPSRSLTLVISGELRNGEAVYCVADTGIGIAPEHWGKIWELFHRLHPERAVPGDGLGLTIVRSALRRMSGRAWVESTPGQGSRFYFALPGADTIQTPAVNHAEAKK